MYRFEYLLIRFLLIFLCFSSGAVNAQTIDCESNYDCKNNIFEIIIENRDELYGYCPDSRGLHVNNFRTFGCNKGSSGAADIIDSECIEPDWAVSWYKINAESYKYGSIIVNSNDIRRFTIDIFDKCSGNSILNELGYACDTLLKYHNSLIISDLSLYSYNGIYLAVGSEAEDAGSFELIVDLYNEDISYDDGLCNIKPARIVADKQPPYSAGEEVTFTVTAVYSQDVNKPVLWQQAIIPVFGEGWDISSFQYVGGPPDIFDGLDNLWKWYDDEEVRIRAKPFNLLTFKDVYGRLGMTDYSNLSAQLNEIKCLNQDSGLPGGWYAVSNGGGPDCENDGHPNNSWGSPRGYEQIQFTLRVKDYDYWVDDMDEVSKNLGIQVYQFTDYSIGCWFADREIDICYLDKPGVFSSSIETCKGVSVNYSKNIISGEKFNYSIETDQDSYDSNISFSWEIIKPEGVRLVYGSSEGTGKILNNQFVNLTPEIQTVTYKITAVNGKGCKSYSDIHVHISPDNKILYDKEVLKNGFWGKNDIINTDHINDWKIFPNPFQNKIFLESNNENEENYTIFIRSVLDADVFRHSFRYKSGSLLDIDAVDWISGVYIITIESDTETMTRKIIKM